ncbi:TPA: restriction endonuclease subunit S [Vibrio parahaemolyticus]|nr:restriction endonuclease subunit S [Vibrio parahaemolyticus]
MSQLPKGWVETKWDNIVGVDGFRRGPFGGNLKKSCFVDEGYAVYEQYAPINDDCEQFRYFITQDKFDELKGFQVHEGDFLISCSGTMGRITCVPKGAPIGVINQALLRIRLQDNYIDSNYFLRLFKSPLIQQQVLNKSVGGAIQNLAAVKELKEIRLPIAPLPEQKRIVEKLDEVLAQVDTIKARLDGIPDLLKRFRQSVLASAVSGKLTEEWRENHSTGVNISELEDTKKELIETKEVKKDLDFEIANTTFDIPTQWVFLKLKSLAYKITDGEHKTPRREESGRFLLSARNVRDGYLCLENVDYVGEEEYQKLRKRCDPNKGDILISCSGSVGRVSLVDQDDSYVMVRSAALVKVLKKYVHNKFLMYVLQSPMLQKRIDESSKSTAQSNLFLGPIKDLEIPTPALIEQKEIVRLVDQYFAFADTIEAQVKKAQARVDNLTQSILAKAFRGELVPQNDDDEPAEVLLERIAQARKEAEALAKAAKKAAKTKKTSK